MILDPYELRKLAYEMQTPANEVFEQKLLELHNKHLTNNHHVVLIPQFWSETVFYGLQKMIEQAPQITFGSILDVESKLRVFTTPSLVLIEGMKLKLYNEIDTLILETIECLANGVKKPFFMT